MSRRKSQSSSISLFSFQDAITSVCGVVVLVTLMLALELTKRVESVANDSDVDAQQVQQTQEEIAELQARLQQVQESYQDQNDPRWSLAGVTYESAQSKRELAQNDFDAAKDSNDQAKKNFEKLKAEHERKQDKLTTRARLQTQLEQLQEDTSKLKEQVAEEVASSGREVAFVYNANASDKPWFVETTGSGLRVHDPEGLVAPCDYSSVKKFMSWAKTRNGAREYFVVLARPSGVDFEEQLESELKRASVRFGVDLLGENVAIRFTSNQHTER